MKELRKLAWVSCIEPLQTSLAKDATRQLMPDFQAQTRRFRVAFDTSSVSAFLEEETETARRVTLLVEAGVLRVDRAQEMLGLEVDSTQAIYLRPSSSAPVTSDKAAAEALPPAATGNALNGGPPSPEAEADGTITRADRLLEHWEKTGGTEA